MLRETLRDGLGETMSGCLDAETLAAWSDGTLGRRDRADAEAHAATCARCQAMLAAMAKTAPPLPARTWWQSSTVRWLVPVATVSALAVVVWMNAPAQRLAVPAAHLAAPASSAPAPVSEADRADIAPSKVKDAPKVERPAEAKRAEQRDARADKENAPAPAAAAEPLPSLLEQAPSPSAAPKGEAAQAFAPVVAAAPPPPPPQAQSAAPAQPPPPAPSRLRSLTDRVAADVVIRPSTAAADRLSAQSAIRSPDENVRWRIVAGTAVERSTDGGTSWQTQSTGAPVRLVAGAAPSATVCWLVGAGGVVLLSKDGRTWERVAFPEAIDLAAIRTTDASNATVTAVDGRRFTTADGGRTWHSP